MSGSQRVRTIVDEIVPLAQRVRAMRIFRLALTIGVTAYAAYAPQVASVPVIAIAAGAGLYLAFTLLIEGVWRLTGGRSLLLFGIMLIADGIFLAWLVYGTGGPVSPFLGLTLVHIIAVTLLASYRTGLKLAMWHSLLLLCVYYAQDAQMVAPGMAHPPVPDPDAFQRLVLFVGISWGVAFVTATFSAVNERELRRRRYDLEALAKLATGLEAASNGREVAEVLLDSLADTFGFERGVVLSKRSDEVEVLASRGVSLQAAGPMVGTDLAMRKAWEARASVLVSRLDPKTNPTLSELLPQARNVVAVPLTAETGSIGLVAVEHPARLGGRVARRVVSTVDRFCAHASLALRNASLVDQLRHLADIDPLTGVANRGTFERTLEKELSRASRGGGHVGLVMIDIDHFKQLNDTHGHRVGDDVLRRMTMTLQVLCRNFDTAARYGGEEFAVVLPGSDAEAAMEVGERIRRAIGGDPGSPQITVSVGVAAFPVHAADGESLVKAADAALYESKRSGRNRTTSAGRTLADESEEWIRQAPNGQELDG